MKFIYPAVFRKNEEGRYKAFFPDLACCEAEGDTLDDAIDNANEAAYNWIYAEVMEDEMDLPAISDESDLDLLEGDIVRNIQVNICSDTLRCTICKTIFFSRFALQKEVLL